MEDQHRESGPCGRNPLKIPMIDGFLWLLAQMSFLLLGAGALCLWVGWAWRARKARAQVVALNAAVESESDTAEAALKERQAAQAQLEERAAEATRGTALLLEAREQQLGLERQILRLHEELRAAKREETVAVLPRVETERASMVGAGTPVAPRTPPPDPSPSPQRARIPPITPVSLESVAAPGALGALRDRISTQRMLIEALDQERAGWELRVESLRPRAPADPAGFALASKSLARSRTQHDQALAALANLDRQARALERVVAEGEPVEDDDLTRIKGIKSSLDKQLRALGVRSYRQIAGMSDEDLQALSEFLSFKNRAQRDEWKRQAAELHEAKYGSAPE